MYVVRRPLGSLVKLTIELFLMHHRLSILLGWCRRFQVSQRGRRGAHLNMEAQPAPDQMEWTTTGYTQAAMKKEYRAYASTRARSAIAPDTMVHAVAANCA